MDAELQFNKKPVQACIHARVWHGCDGPYAAAVRFSKSDFGRRRGEVMVVDSEAHGLAKIHAAEERKSVHAISRDVKSQAGVIGKYFPQQRNFRPFRITRRSRMPRPGTSAYKGRLRVTGWYRQVMWEIW